MKDTRGWCRQCGQPAHYSLLSACRTCKDLICLDCVYLNTHATGMWKPVHCKTCLAEIALTEGSR